MYKETGYQFSEDDYFALKGLFYEVKGLFDEEGFEKDKIYTAAEIKQMKQYALARIEEIFDIGEESDAE